MLLSAFTGFFVEFLTLFGIVLIHEFGHVMAARSLGWRIKEVLLLPFGGVAEVDDASAASSRDEMIVALAGPLQNGIMITLALVMREWGTESDTAWWDYFLTANTIILLFNLLPVLPLDGGKILQAMLSYIMQYHHTLVMMTLSSLLLSAVMIVCACTLWSGPGIQLNLAMIGAFLLYSNWMEYRNLSYRHLRFLIGRHRRTWGWIGRGTLAQPIVVNGQRTVGEVLRMFMREKYHLVYVLNQQGKICGVFTEQRVIEAFFDEKKVNSAVSDLLVLK